MALQDLTMMLPSHLDCPLSLETPNMGNPGSDKSVHFAHERSLSIGQYEEFTGWCRRSGGV